MSDMNSSPNNDTENKSNRAFEQFEIAGGQLVDRIKDIIEEGNVRRVIIRNPEGRVLLEIPLTVGAVAGGALLFLYPVIAAVGALAALVARVTVEIVREEPDATIQDVENAVEDTVDDVREKLSE
jgi:hypothetical protein